MSRLHPLRAGMALIALSIQPLQVGLLAGFGQAMAGCVSTPTNHCAPPGDPGGNPPTIPEVQYYLSPGFGALPSTNDVNTTTAYFGGNASSGYDFESYLRNSNTTANPVRVTAPAADYLNTTIPTQARALANGISSTGSVAKSIVLVGHSTGVARIREALEHDATYTNMNKVVGLVSIGGANDGAPIAQNAAPLAGFLTSVYGSALVYAFPTTAAVVFPLVLYARNYVDTLVNNPTAQDLMPGSSFFRNLNDPAQGTVRAAVKTLEVRGANNNLDALLASGVSSFTTSGVTAARDTAGSVMAVFAGIAWASAFWTMGMSIPLAILLTVASITTFTLPAIWQARGVGSAEGDAFLTRATQTLPASMGGTPATTPVVLNTAVHVGDFGELNVRNRREYAESGTFRQGINSFQAFLGLTTSPAP